MQLLERDYVWGNGVSSCEECAYTIQYLQVTGSYPLANETQLLIHNDDDGVGVGGGRLEEALGMLLMILAEAAFDQSKSRLVRTSGATRVHT